MQVGNERNSEYAVKERKPTSEKPKPTPAQSNPPPTTAIPSPITVPVNTEKKEKLTTPNEPIKENKKELPKKEVKNQPKRQVNFRGRVGEFHRDALYRSIPIALQRNAYKETVPVFTACNIGPSHCHRHDYPYRQFGECAGRHLQGDRQQIHRQTHRSEPEEDAAQAVCPQGPSSLLDGSSRMAEREGTKVSSCGRSRPPV